MQLYINVNNLIKEDRNVWFIGCTHFGHYNIIKYCDRPFKTIEEQDERLIANWNSVVKEEDIVFHLGDFGFKFPEYLIDVRKRLNGYIYLIEGNHDRAIKQSEELRKTFQAFTKFIDLRVVNSKQLFLIHIRQYDKCFEWMGRNTGVILVHAHSHNHPINILKNAINVSAEVINYTPISYQQLIAKGENNESNKSI